MYSILSYYTLGFTLFTFSGSITKNVPADHVIEIFEYGEHCENEEPTFARSAVIPAFVPIYIVELKHERPDLEQRFTFIRVEYVSPLSIVHVTYNEESFKLTFHIIYPMIRIRYGVVGYSVPPPAPANTLSGSYCSV